VAECCSGLTDQGDKTIEDGDGEDDDADKGFVCVFHIGYNLMSGVGYPEITAGWLEKLFCPRDLFVSVWPIFLFL
jgi:hypothetical protein